MKRSKLIVCLLTLGCSFAPPSSGQIVPEQLDKPELKPDLPKLGVPKQSVPANREPLKGSIQHSEVIKPNSGQTESGEKENGRLGGSSRQSQLNGTVGKGLFKQKNKPLNSGTNQDTETGLGIIGLKFSIYFGHPPVIYQVFPGTPAGEAGVRAKDLIIAVDGIPTMGLAKNEVYNMIVGQPGTEVTLSFMHNHSIQVKTLKRMDVNAIPDPRVRRDYLSM